MNISEIISYVVCALLVIGSIGWYIYDSLIKPPPVRRPIPLESVSALRQERDALLKEDQIFNERLPLYFEILFLLQLRFDYRIVPLDPPGTEAISNERLGKIVIVFVFWLVTRYAGHYVFKQRVRTAAKAALGDDARPTMRDGKRHARLSEIKALLKTVPPAVPSSNTHS
jgi:hypothetical protein